MDILLHSLNRKSPTNIVKIVNSESVVPEAIDNPNLEVTRPNVIKTRGEIIINRSNQKENLLPSCDAQIALIELANNARPAEPII